jgi:ADP-heptose:LPS heptosyltransferase
MSGLEHILLIRLKSIGDILFTLPAVHRLRDAFPSSRITFLASSENVPLLSGFAAVNEVVGLDRLAFSRLAVREIWANSASLALRLWRQKFDLVVDFQGYGETALLTWLTRAPQRWGNVYRVGRGWAYTRGVTRNDSVHPAEWNLALLRQCGLSGKLIRNEFRLLDDHVQAARAFFREHGCDPAKPTMYLQPFTSSPQKNWPLGKYLALARQWREWGVQVIFGGGPPEREVLEPAHQAGFPVSAGVPLLTTAGLMKLATLVAGGDTGTLHLAVAMGKRIVMVMSSITPGSTHPLGHPEWAVTPQNSRSVAGIEVDAVIQATVQAFAELGASPPALNSRPA